jgi:hypothetical protein
MPVPVIVAGISAIGGLISTKMANSAASNAAEQQVQSGDRALDVLSNAYQPYMSMGAASLGQLGENLGIPMAPAAPGAPTTQAVPGGPGAPTDPRAQAIANQVAQGHGVKRPIDPQALANQQAQGHGRSLGEIATGPQTHARQQTQSGFGGRVRLQAPDGSQQEVGSDEADHYLRLGARRVG